MRAAPAVSILLPVRDAEGFLDEALDSLALQTFEQFEVVAVDDGSSDGSRSILRRRAHADPRVRFFSQEPAGIVAALERARLEARAPLLARMDADDVAHPNRLAKQLERMGREPPLAACGCRVRYFPDDGVGDGARRYERWLNSLGSAEDVERDLFVECPLAHPTLVLDAAAVAEVGGYRDCGWPEDYDLLLRLWEAGHRLGTVPEVLLRWRERPERLSRSHSAYGLDAFRRVKVHFLRRTLLQNRRGLVVWGAGPTGKAFAREAKRQEIPLLGFVDLAPGRIGQEIHGAPVVHPEELETFEDAFVVSAVSGAGPRAEIREELRAAGWREGIDFVAVA